MTRRTPEQYDFSKLSFDEQWLKKHYSSLNKFDKRYIVVHHMTIPGNGDTDALDACYATWQTRQASAHYGVAGFNVRQYVLDKDYAWATGSTAGNLYGISIEHENSKGAPSWSISDPTMKTGAKLVAYLHKVYKLGRPVSGVTLRRHKSFFATACPGPYMITHWAEYVAEAQRVYDEITKTSPTKPLPTLPPEEEAEDDTRWWKGALVNFGASTAALDKPGGRTRWEERKEPGLDEVISIGADVIGCIETGAGKPNTYIRSRLRNGGYLIADTRAKARNIAYNPDSVVPVEAGFFDLPRASDNNDMPSPWLVARIDGSLAVIVLSHLDYRNPKSEAWDRLRERQAAAAIAGGEKLAKKHGVSKSRIIHMMDMADEGGDVRRVFERKLYGDAFKTATKKVNASIKSKNDWKKAVAGVRVDLVAAYVGEKVNQARPFLVMNQRLTRNFDHQIQAFIVGRQQ